VYLDFLFYTLVILYIVSIKNSVSQGHSFKGFPIMFNHYDSKRIVRTLEEGAVSADIIETIGDKVAFGVRVKVQNFAEGVCAVWVMLAVRFRPLLKA
jgi:centrosomal protein CEP76